MTISFCGLELAHPIINASGTFDAIAARRAFGDELLERFPFAAFVSKTVTLAPDRISSKVAPMPAGPEPTTATRIPEPRSSVLVSAGIGALSAMKRSIAPIATGVPPASDQVQEPSHCTA